MFTVNNLYSSNVSNQLCCLIVFDIRILIIPLVSLISSYGIVCIHLMQELSYSMVGIIDNACMQLGPRKEFVEFIN